MPTILASNTPPKTKFAFILLHLTLFLYLTPSPASAFSLNPLPLSQNSIKIYQTIYTLITEPLLTLNSKLHQLTHHIDPNSPQTQTISTNHLGIAKSILPKGVYQLSATPPQDFDLILPQAITVTTPIINHSSTYILIGIAPGNGRLLTYAQPDTKTPQTNLLTQLQHLLPASLSSKLSSQPSSTQILGTSDTVIPQTAMGKVELQLFTDTNRNGQKDPDEIVAINNNIDFHLSPSDSQLVYSLLNGWNLVHFPLIPSTFTTASELIQEIAREGGYVTTVATWENGAWKEYLQRGDQVFSLEDFPIEPGKAYFLRSHQKMDWLVTGTPAPITSLSLQPGWNSLGLSPTANIQTAQQIIDFLNQQNSTENVTEIDQWNSGTWQVFVKRLYSEDNIRQYGDDFSLSPNQGYMIKSKDFFQTKLKEN